ncbi:MAG: hypothetical protein PWP24_1050 [Clostridiales bacterium]|nr:hypothetical protein [Clostridiales bacterium]
MIRVWFNHWFSTSYGLIEWMKKDVEQEIYVIASNKQIDSVIQKVCDEWYQDSPTDGEEYIQYCIAFCKEHKIDVFVPRRKMLEISQNRERFEDIGVKLLVDDYEAIKLLNNKAATYDFFRSVDGINIPDYEIVNTASQFEAAYSRLKTKYEQVCVKFVKDEGAMSYRRIVDQVEGFKRLRIYPGAEMEYKAYVSALDEVKSFDDLMVMPYLPGNEISVDCLKTDKGLISIPRYKGSARHEKIIFDQDILNMTEIVMKNIKLEYPCNVQYRIKDGIPYLLEINTRMSGGLQMSCFAKNINIPNIALNKLLGKSIHWSFTKEERVVSYIELPQVIR